MTSLPDGDQQIGYFSSTHPDHLVPLFFILAKFEHISQYSHFMTSQFCQQVERCQHGLGRGIICIIENQSSFFRTNGCKAEL